MLNVDPWYNRKNIGFQIKITETKHGIKNIYEKDSINSLNLKNSYITINNKFKKPRAVKRYGFELATFGGVCKTRGIEICGTEEAYFGAYCTGKNSRTYLGLCCAIAGPFWTETGAPDA